MLGGRGDGLVGFGNSASWICISDRVEMEREIRVDKRGRVTWKVAEYQREEGLSEQSISSAATDCLDDYILLVDR